MSARILVIGATGHIGSAVADAAAAAGHDVVRAARRSGERVDVHDPASLADLFTRVGEVDAVVAAFGGVPFAPFHALTPEDYAAGFRDKVLGQLAVVDAALPHLRDGGSITLTGCILSAHPVPTGAAASVANGALDAYVVAAAPEMPRGIRINVVSPNVLVEAPGYHDSFPGFTPVPGSTVAAAYLDVIDGTQTGRRIAV